MCLNCVHSNRGMLIVDLTENQCITHRNERGVRMFIVRIKSGVILYYMHTHIYNIAHNNYVHIILGMHAYTHTHTHTHTHTLTHTHKHTHYYNTVHSIFSR